MVYNYKCDSSHARNIEIELEGNIIKRVRFDGGCNGNTNGFSRLVVGLDAQFVSDRLLGTPCRHFNGTSCPDQLARGLQEALKEQERLATECK